MITKRAATGAALAAAAVLWLAAPAAADGLPRVVFCDDFTSVDPAQVSFCIEDAQGAVLGGGVSPTAEVLPAVVADPEAVGGWRLAIPEGWAGTAVMGAPPLVATPPPAAAPPPPPRRPQRRRLLAQRRPRLPRPHRPRWRSRRRPKAPPPWQPRRSSPRPPLRWPPHRKRTWRRRTPARRDRAPPGGSAPPRCWLLRGGRPRPAEAQDQRQRR